MKIPQRQDQVALGAPQTQAGRAVQPVEGSLGDSYITAMRGMSKSFQELSDLQFDLSENAIQGQLDSFDIYVQARTKQYNQELSLATNQEDINKLFEQYNKDIDENGTAKLGVTLYGDWKKAKGGNTIAGAEYTGNLASAQLQIKLNQEMLSDSLQELNVLAGQSATADERTSYINQAHELIDNNVKNGTINEAEAQKQKRQFDYDLATSLVIKDMEVNPEYVANALRTNSKYMPELKNPDRIRLAQQAEMLAYKRQGTSSGTNVKNALNIWVQMFQAPSLAGLNKDKATGKYTVETEIPYYNEQGKKVGILHGSYNDIARQVYDISTRNENELRYIMQALYKQQGQNISLENISMDDARSFRKQMRSDYISEENTPQYRAFKAKDDYIQTRYNEDAVYKDNNDKFHIAKGSDFFEKYKDGELKGIKDYGVLVDRIGEINKMLNDNSTAIFLNENDSDYGSYWDKRDNYTKAFIYSIQNNEVAKPKQQWEKEMVAFMKPILDKIDANYPGFDTERKKSLFVTSFLEQNKATSFFDKENKDSYYLKNKDNSSSARNSIKQALYSAGISNDIESYIPIDVKSKADLQLNINAKPYSYMMDAIK